MAEWEESMSTRGGESGEIDTPSVACEAAAAAHEHEQSEDVTAVEGGMLSSRTRSAAEERREYGVWLKQLRSRCGSEEEFYTARSMWTQVASTSSCLSEGMSPAEEEMCVSENRRFFQDLASKQPSSESRHYSPNRSEFERILNTSPFFVDFGGRLQVGETIGAGGQAEIYEALFDGKEPLKWEAINPGFARFVLKVFRLEHSERFRQAWAMESKRIDMQSMKESLYKYRCCYVRNCTILEDGRFAFLLMRYWGDLRKAIDGQILTDKTHLKPPFPFGMSLSIMQRIAVGMRALHDSGILHRDLKAENVLVLRDLKEIIEENVGFYCLCHVGDFESAEGVMGTRFWRAPEVMHILRSNAADKYSDPSVWTPKVDVYAYAMTCYEVLSGCIPFQNRPQNDYDIGDERPLLPEYVDEEIKELLQECWNSDPSKRPSFEIICDKLQRYINRFDVRDYL
ncbi:hypothetical protein KC19_7G102300 [Ceratodon purpureus]|uniref:Protein kinase domain-containing protein n=1 Tax=Ceratodon purpureus TaxID=3225 RepID=A0A8T0HD32_CERPU|nr:hypothetical protein KC19_7G102300 [Ceratodon purpureus]